MFCMTLTTSLAFHVYSKSRTSGPRVTRSSFATRILTQSLVQVPHETTNMAATHNGGNLLTLVKSLKSPCGRLASEGILRPNPHCLSKGFPVQYVVLLSNWHWKQTTGKKLPTTDGPK